MDMKRNSLLLPAFFRLPGFILLAAGSVFGIMRFWFDIKPKFLTMKVFAFYSEYLAEKYFRFVRDNMSEELVGVLLVLGAWMVAFSRDKDETEEKSALRIRAFYISAFLQMVFLVFCLLTTFGIAYIYMLMIYMVLPPATFFIVFRILAGTRKSESSNDQQQ
jgi:L-asparagine transporter-like permease